MRIAVRPETQDLRILLEVVLENCYIPRGWDTGSYSTILDVGAHLGAFSVMAARNWPNAKILAFEPFSENFRLLTHNLRVNDCQQVVPFEIAVAGRSGRKKLHLSASNTGAHSLQRDVGPSVEVAAVSLSEVFEQHSLESIDFLKMDCEGSEYEILESLPQELLCGIQRLAMEFHEIPGMPLQEGASRLDRLLCRNGYQVSTVSGRGAAAGMLYAWHS